MTEATVTIKVRTTEFDTIREALLFVKSHFGAIAGNDAQDRKTRHEAMVFAARAEDLLGKLA